MSESEVNIHALDAAYKPFPAFAEWAAKTSVDTVRWNRYKADLDGRPPTSPDAVKRAYEIVKRAAALDTGAIEGLYEVDRGFTFTVALETTAWELALAEKGENVRSLFEAQLQAYDYVLDFATKTVEISEAAIRKLHEVVCGAQETYRVITSIGFQEQSLPKGKYKVLANHVARTRDGTTHSYAPVDVTPVEMARLVVEMRSEAFLAAHPVIQAAYSHYGLVVIHPFADGNGRVARAIASVFAYRAISMPIMILSEHKEAYLDALEAADRGEYQLFVDFMLARSLDTMMLVHDSMRGAFLPTPEEGAAAIKNLYVTRGGYTQEKIDAAGRQLVKVILAGLQESISKIADRDLQGHANFFVTSGRESISNQSHRLLLRDDQDLIIYQVELRSSAPAFARLSRHYVLWLPKDAGSDDDIQLVRIPGDNTTAVALDSKHLAFSARMDELIPAVSGVLQIRVGLFADRLIGEMLVELKSLAERALKES
jgi:Fic family protein